MTQQKQSIETSPPDVRRARRGNLVGRTVAEVLSFIRNSVFAEEMAERRGLLQGFDPRAKLLAFLVSLAGVLLARRLDVLVGLYLLTLVLAAGSRIPLGFFLKRVWVFIPIFAGIIALPILFSRLPAEQPWLVLWRWHDGAAFGLTKSGLWMAAVLVLRVAASVSLAVLMVLTTRWAHLLKALRVFGVPRIFVLTLEMTYRYIFLFVGILQAEHLAKESRTIRPAPLRAERRWATSRIGRLFLRSRQMGEEVYLAMLSRGYSGEAKLLHPFQLRMADAIGLAVSASVLLCILWLNKGA